MKNLSLPFMYLFVFSLLVYSCVKEKTVVPQMVNNDLQLTSPNHYVLANSNEALIDKMMDELIPVYGENYEFGIDEIVYSIEKELTNAEILYTTTEGQKRNMIFYWLHPTNDLTASERAQVDADAAPVCTGECDDEGFEYQCKAKWKGSLGAYVCYCFGDDRSSSHAGGCVLNAPDGKKWTCEGECSIAHEAHDCHPAYFPDGDVICVCNGQESFDCGTPMQQK